MNPPLWQRLLIGRNPRVTLLRAVVIGAACFAVFKFAYLPMWVEGSSMEPTYASGGFNFVNRLAYRSREPERGDVVAIRMPKTRAMLMKRIVGLPGERFEIRRNEVFINGEKLAEPYVKLRAERPKIKPWWLEPRILGPDKYYVIGDNRGVDITAHAHGPVKRNDIEGKLAF